MGWADFLGDLSETGNFVLKLVTGILFPEMPHVGLAAGASEKPEKLEIPDLVVPARKRKSK